MYKANSTEVPGWRSVELYPRTRLQRLLGTADIGSESVTKNIGLSQERLDRLAPAVYEWHDGKLERIADLSDGDDLLDVVKHSGVYYISPPGMGVKAKIDLTTVN